MAVVQGPSAELHAVRRGLWLPRRPDERRPLAEVFRTSTGTGFLALLPREHGILVFGGTVVSIQKEWRDLSQGGGRVFTFLFQESLPGNLWALYEDGRTARFSNEAAGMEQGRRHPLEPPRNGAEHPADCIRAIYRGMTGADIAESRDLRIDVDVWLVPRPRQ
jgi:hypothetical protein